MKKNLLTMLVVAIFLGIVNPLAAQNETKPVLTISFCGYDELMNNIGMFGRLGGNEDLDKNLEFMLQMMTQGNGLSGIDKTQPWGAVFTADKEDKLNFYCFIPVTELKKLVETSEAMQIAKNVELNDGLYTIQTGDKTLYAQEKGKWAYIAQEKDALADVAADPLELLGDLPKNYDLAFRASAKNAPKALKEQLLAQIRAGFELGSARMPNETNEQYEFRSTAAKQSLQQLTTLFTETDEVMLGLNIDPSKNAFYLDFELTAQDGTKLAEQLALAKPGKSHFGGFYLPEAAFSANSFGTMCDTDVAQAKTGLATMYQAFTTMLADQDMDTQEYQAITKFLEAAIDCLKKTVETRKSDSGMALLLDPEAVTVLAGAAVAGGNDLEKAAVKFVGELEKIDAEAAKLFKLNAETYQGVRFHTFKMPLPDPKLEAMLGDEFEVVLGISDDRLYLAAGRDAVKSLKEAMDRSKSLENKEVLPTRVSMSAAAIAKFAAKISPDQQTQMVAAIFSATLAEAKGKDHLLLTAAPIKRGIRVRLELEEGLLKAISTIGSQMSGMGQGGM